MPSEDHANIELRLLSSTTTKVKRALVDQVWADTVRIFNGKNIHATREVFALPAPIGTVPIYQGGRGGGKEEN